MSITDRPTYVSEKAKAMIAKLQRIDDTTNRLPGCDPADLVPVKELTRTSLANTGFGSQSAVTVHTIFPYLDPETKKPVGGFGYAYITAFVFNDGTAVAVHRTWLYSRMDLAGNVSERPNQMANKMVIKFYLLGCDHEYESTTIGKCEHRLKCTKCGHTYVVDSSD